MPIAASAHSVLVRVTPVSDARVASTPKRVTLTFNEPVNVTFGGVKVYGPRGQRVDQGGARRNGDDISIGIDDAGAGTYAVAWRVTSADTHPVTGAFVFHSVRASTDDLARQRARDASRRSPTLEAAFSVARGMYMLGVLLAAGGVAFVLICHHTWRVRGLGLSLTLAALGAAAAFVLDASVVGGFSLLDTLRWSVLSEQAGTTYGRASIIRLLIVIACLVVARFVSSRWLDRTRAGRVLLALPFVALAASLSISGHALSTGTTVVRLPLDMLHAGAAAIWFGGLVQLWLALRTAAASGAVPVEVVRRWSRVALGAVIVLVITGAVAAFQLVGLSVDALLHTDYGRMYAVKVGLFLLTMPLAAINRQRNVPGMVSGEVSAEQRRGQMQRFARVEALLIFGVIAVTALLIQTRPAVDSVTPEPIDRTVQLKEGASVQLVVDPAVAGRNEIHIYVLAKGGSPDPSVTSIAAMAALPKREITNLDLALQTAGPGHAANSSATIPLAGTWKVAVEIKRGKFSAERVQFTIPVVAPR